MEAPGTESTEPSMLTTPDAPLMSDSMVELLRAALVRRNMVTHVGMAVTTDPPIAGDATSEDAWFDPVSGTVRLEHQHGSAVEPDETILGAGDGVSPDEPTAV
jgi:hypothetical protein